MRQGQGSTAFRLNDRTTFKQSLKLLGGDDQLFVQYSTTYFCVHERYYSPQCFDSNLCT